MANRFSSPSWLFFLFTLASFLLANPTGASEDGRKAYIVYMGELPKDGPATSLQTSMLQEVLGSNVSTCLLCNYKKSFNGFAVKLTDDEREKLGGMDGVVSIFPNEKMQLETTKSWDFMGFSQKVTRAAIESDIIVGVLDTGIWPESDSFSDEGFRAPPSKWKGTCQSSNITCNNKIIGARYYRSDGNFTEGDIVSPRDSDGHGTHTASTAAGNLVSMASLNGLALGTARGGVPSARIAVYKVCWPDGCHAADILAAFDDAIADGVDIISLSIGYRFPRSYFEDPLAIGAFHAMKNGILTSSSAGNNGPNPATITKVEPWSLSVAASTIDRKFFTKVQLGNNNTYEGVSINTIPLDDYPIIYGGDAPNITAGFNGSSSRYCLRNSLDEKLVKGKIVLCDALVNGVEPLSAGAVGMVMQDEGLQDVAYSFPLPATHLDLTEGSRASMYINTTSNPTATIFKTTESKDGLAPFVASFSSRGPNPITSDILKPDLTAPGVHILAAWSPLSPVSRIKGDKRFVHYNLLSGTSMSCPHVTGIAAYVKSFHPTWSPAAIKSSLMTTAFPLSNETNPDAEFAYGAGHVNPSKAVYPGLIYDADVADYIKFLCGQGYNAKQLQLVTGDRSTCSQANIGAVWDLNYPSFAVSILQSESISRYFIRTVTNVGSPTSIYKAKVTAPYGLNITVEPGILSFKSLGEKLSFNVTVEGVIHTSMVSASLVWDDGMHQVRSPIVVYVLS